MSTGSDWRPRLAITLGDPGGIGPEVVLGALARDDVRTACQPVIVGDAAVLRKAAALPGISATVPADLLIEPTTAAGSPGPFASGRVDPENGRAAHGWICRAVEMARSGEADAIVTGPIAKEAMFAAGFDFPGHTELLARLCGGADVRMMLEGGGLRVVLETIHVAIADVPRLITVESLGRTLGIAHRWGNEFLRIAPRIAVCGLNPHAGEGGHFGDEEVRVIAPAIARARGDGIRADGPVPADTVFHRALAGDFDLVVAMYHDQALIPVKTLDFHGGVNTTIGLPIIRTSPDHGTAFDLAGKGTANPSSMAAAILRAADLARKRRG